MLCVFVFKIYIGKREKYRTPFFIDTPMLSHESLRPLNLLVCWCQSLRNIRVCSNTTYTCRHSEPVSRQVCKRKATRTADLEVTAFANDLFCVHVAMVLDVLVVLDLV